MKRYLTEIIGTFFLVLTIGLATTATPKISFPELAIASALMVMVYMGGHISGAHYNPAVSLAVMLRGKLSPIDFVPYVVCQLAGSLLACYVVHQINGGFIKVEPHANTTPVMAIIVEFIFTFALALVVLNVATAKGTEGNSFYGLAIGFTVLVGAMVGGGISGGAFNPAVGFGPITFNFWMKQGELNNLGYYIVGPFLGGAVAAAVFWVQNAEWKVSMSSADKK
ncbi:MAG: aquaporin [Planctomycetia bacterium]|nr:aquaporin [Planctomycetia bacterium]